MTSRSARLDGLRALAALTVLGYHVALWGGLTRRGLLAPLLGELKAGVAIFFVLSGYLLYLPVARALGTGRPLPDWRRYARRRLARILPAYWLALTVVAILLPQQGVFGPDAWRYYGLSQIYAPDLVLGGLGVAWSLCVEITFYALLPSLAWALRRRVGRRVGMAAAAVQLRWLAVLGGITLLLRILSTGSLLAPVSGDGTLLIALPGYLDWFALGMALAVLSCILESGCAPRWLVGLAPWGPARLVAGVALVAVGGLTAGGDIFLPLCGWLTHLAIGVGSALTVSAVTLSGPQTSAGRHSFAWAALARLGESSYGIYLWHVPVLMALGGSFAVGNQVGIAHLLGIGLLVVVAASGLGRLSFTVIERPALRLADGRGRRARAAVPDLAAGVGAAP
jgi:peptidoglycan/LPS O-acetylase OafA/YrhL